MERRVGAVTPAQQRRRYLRSAVLDTQLTQAGEYCSDLVRRTNEDLWLSAQYAQSPLKNQLLAVFAAHSEIQRIPSAVSEPPLGEIRLQWWREAFDEIVAGGAVRAHPVVEALNETGVVAEPFLGFMAPALDARARLFYGEPFKNIGDLFGWIEEAEGALAPLTLKMADADAAFFSPAQTAATAYHAARHAKALAPELSAAASEEAHERYRKARAPLSDLPAGATPGVLYLSLTKAYLKRGPEASWPVAKRLRLFRAMATGRL